MYEHIQSTAEPRTVPSRIRLEDFADAVSRGVVRALQAEDDVVGFTPVRKPPVKPTVIGIVQAPPPSQPQLPPPTLLPTVAGSNRASG